VDSCGVFVGGRYGRIFRDCVRNAKGAHVAVFAVSLSAVRGGLEGEGQTRERLASIGLTVGRDECLVRARIADDCNL
jgi:hypothetical protein